MNLLNESSLTIIDVGHGSCAVVSNGVQTVLIDSGPGAAVLEYLLQEGVKTVDTVVLSHADEDHIRGLISLLGVEEFEVRRVLLNSDAAKGSAAWQGLAYELDDRRRRGLIDFETQLREGDVVPGVPPGVSLEVVAPRDRLVMLGPGSKDRVGNRITTNTISAVILVRSGCDRVALITGDLDRTGFGHLIDAGQNITADVLVFPHHGGLAGGPFDENHRFANELVLAVKPHTVAISLGRNRFRNPRPEIIDGMRQGSTDIRIACTQLSSHCAVVLPSENPPHLLPLFANGSRDKLCCAGSMRIQFDGAGIVQPLRREHDSFIDSLGTPLCRR